MSRLEEVKKTIESGKAVLGIELGSTRIKAVLVDQMGTVIETGGFDWENSLVNGIWTYSLEEVWTGIQKCYKDLSDKVKEKYDITIKRLASMGISAMDIFLLIKKGSNWLNFVHGEIILRDKQLIN